MAGPGQEGVGGMNLHLSHSWEIDDDHMDLTLPELIELATEPGGMLDGALFEHHVMLAGHADWEIDTATPTPRLRVVVPVAPWTFRGAA